ncbi:histidine phosphatase superfamily-domain-containing protein [Tribonema minus]|uniref:Inositol hexakisphosphate and diphosphoinositol-pentakisphosphate kinase n=1 Tax=Tribonema minus TaxID=303371 RepID=A0A836CKZ8_9STRA|nr:histidine phosphatase superfamily-domain-containing protein [Tribonema minus]
MLKLALERYDSAGASRLDHAQQTQHSERGHPHNGPYAESRNESIITLGVCAMDKKIQSDGMQALLACIPGHLLEVRIFGDECLLNSPVQRWPRCDALLAFASNGFPLEKAKEYVQLYQPFVLNDLELQSVLQSRKAIYGKLASVGVPTPRHVIVNREGGSSCDAVIESEDSISVNGVTLHKPFVEKPLDADNHHIHIYYPSRAGGGSKRLFRKVQDRSSTFHPGASSVRRDGSYLYEEFIDTCGVDIKCYTCGPALAHAEGRRSPALDGRVVRDANGKEKRHPVVLTALEQDIARRISLAFKQLVCGFDLLRETQPEPSTRGPHAPPSAHPAASLVCDVNGWSMAKATFSSSSSASSSSTPGYATSTSTSTACFPADCARLVTACVLQALRPAASVPPAPLPLAPLSTAGSAFGGGGLSAMFPRRQWPQPPSPALYPPAPSAVASMERSTGALAVSVKLVVTATAHSPILNYFYKHAAENAAEAAAAAATASGNDAAAAAAASAAVWRNGIKVKSRAALQAFLVAVEAVLRDSKGCPEARALCQMRDVLTRRSISGINRKLQIKPRSSRSSSRQSPSPPGAPPTPPPCSEVLLVLKSSDEGRVMKTAAAFAKGMLQLEGDLTPIIVSLVQVQPLVLDRSLDDGVKAMAARGQELLMQTEAVPTSFAPSLKRTMSPQAALTRMHVLLGDLVQWLEGRPSNAGEADKADTTGGGETLRLALERWKKLWKNLRPPAKASPTASTPAAADANSASAPGSTTSATSSAAFNVSKVTDVHDACRYEAVNRGWARDWPGLQELAGLARALAQALVPLERGCGSEGGLLSARTCAPLMRKLAAHVRTAVATADADQYSGATAMQGLPGGWQGGEHTADEHCPPRTRLYFTSESHMVALVQLLVRPPPGAPPLLDAPACRLLSETPELCYLSQVVFRLLEEVGGGESSERFRLECRFSPGAHGDPFGGRGGGVEVAPLRLLGAHISLDEFEHFIQAVELASDTERRGQL